MFFKLFEGSERVFQLLQGKGYGAKSLRSEVQDALAFVPKSDALIFDVGGNKGLWAKEMFAAAGSRVSRLYCFEPSRHNHAAIASIADPRLTLVKTALSDEVGEAKLYYDKVGSGLASLNHRRLDHFNIQMDQEETVPVTTLDRFIAERGITSVDFAKFDIEGYEYKALLGGRKAFDDGTIKAMSFEFGGYNIDTRTYFQDFWYFLNERNYQIYVINPLFPPHRIKRYREALEHFRTTNYIAVKTN